MRNRFLLKSAVAALCAVVLGLVGCDNGSDAQPAAVKGTVRVVMEDGQAGQTDARTAVPANPGFAYTLTFTASGKSPVSIPLSGNAGEVELEVGTWTLTASGSKDGVNVAEGGPVTVNVSSDEGAVSVSVPIRPVLNGADGTFRYNISTAEGLTVVSARLTALNIGEFGELTTNLSTAGGLQTESLMPGYYWLEVTVRRGSLILVRREAVHIYTGATTMKSYNLTDEDFYGIGLGGVTAYLVNAQGGGAADEPVPLVVGADSLGSGGWETLLSAINSSGKYVALDLSVCAMVGTEFDPGTDNAGAAKVVELILPDAAQSIKAGTYNNNSTTYVYDSTFKAFTSLGSISGANVETVGDNAFYHCYALKSVSLPLATSIGTNAFQYCSALESVSLPLVQTIPDGSYNSYSRYGVFSGCTALKVIDLSSATSIGNYAFYGTALTSVDLPSATSIGDSAFEYCTALTELSLPAAETIGTNAFQYCSALESVSLPAVQTIPDGSYDSRTSTYSGVFIGCTALKAVDLPAVTSIGSYAFYNCTALESASLPLAASIGSYAFYGCRALELVDMSSAASIGSYAFYNCVALTSVDLPSATSIGDSAFRNCTALESVSLPAFLTTIGSIAFSGCTNLSFITVDSANTAFSARDGMLMNKAETTLIAYPSASGDITLPNIISVGSYAFRDCTALESVSLPAVQTIPAGSSSSGVFYGCTALKAIDLPAVTSVGNYAFYNCAALTSANLPAATSIGGSAFQGCSALESVSLPLVRTIPAGSYNSNTGTSSGVFYDCTVLKAIDLPLATSIGAYAFSGAALDSVSLPAVRTIGSFAFSACTALTSVDLPSATSIGDRAFSACTALTSVSLPTTPPSISTDSYGIFYMTGSGTITITVPAGAVSAYTSKWGVSASTSASSGNTSGVYGSRHKAVLITDGVSG